VGLGIVGISANEIDLFEISEFGAVERTEFAADDQMQKLAGGLGLWGRLAGHELLANTDG
jgi:hypothetical protein